MTHPTTVPPRILVVEDEPNLGADMARALSELGYEVVDWALTGMESVESAGRHHPDVVLMDVRLPGAISGTDAARLIDEFFGIPIVYVTGVRGREELRRIMLSAPHGYVLKPFGHSELLAAVELALHRWRSERVHRDREDWFEHILENQQDVVAVLDVSGTVDYVSSPIRSVLGSPPEAFVGRTIVEQVHPNDRERFREAMASAFAEPSGLLELDGRFRTEAGGWRLLHVEGRRYGGPRNGPHDGNGRMPPRIVANLRQVEEQRRLQARGNRIYPALRHDAAGAFQVSESGKILDVNRAVVKMLGYDSRRDLIGRSAADLILDRRTLARLSRAFRRERTLRDVEVRLRSRDGAEVIGLLAANVTRSLDESAPVVVGTVMDITERKRLEDDLERMAFQDPLTGLANRRYLGEIAAKYLALARRRGTRLGVVYLDLADFKAINDTFGHAAGDDVLAEVARRLRAAARDSDTLSRVGGDEFVMLLPDVASVDAAVEVAQRVEREFHEPIAVGASSANVQGEIGVAVFPEHGSEFEELLRAADGAMYRAKKCRDTGSAPGVVVAGDEQRPPGSERTLRPTGCAAIPHDTDALGGQPARTRSSLPSISSRRFLYSTPPE